MTPFKYALVPTARLLPVQNENKFKCPCHGSQYNAEGKVVRGPAPLVRLGAALPLCPASALWHCPQSPSLILGASMRASIL